MDAGEGISLSMLDAIHREKSAADGRRRSNFSRLSEASSGVFSADSSISAGDSLTRALEELRLRDSEVGEEVDSIEMREVEPAFPETEVEPAIKRCQSLSSSTNQQRSARRAKKVVRFADALGLELTNVRHIVDVFESVTEADLIHQRPDCHWMEPPPPPKPRLIVCPRFPQPETRMGFLTSVITQKVMLERAVVSQDGISGVVRVSNLHFEKLVTVLLTIDGWRSHREVPARFQPPSSCCGQTDWMTDRFAFSADLPAEFGSRAGNRAALCVRYEVAGQTYWDSNYGENYQFDCLPVSAWGWGDFCTAASFL